jgi:hypothetical protein
MWVEKGVGFSPRGNAARWKGKTMSLHGRLSMPRLSISKDFLVDLEGAALLALVPVALCVLLFAAELFGR